MKKLILISLAIYLACYSFEGLIRYILHLGGADYLIFARDAVLVTPLFALLVKQLLTKQVHPAFILFFLVIILHGTVMMLNIGSFPAVAYGAKMLMTLVAGAIGMHAFYNVPRKMLFFIFFLWAVTLGGVFADKYFVDVPWMGLETDIGDVQVDIGRDWMVSGAEKRAGGFTRSSINAATLLPLLALVLMFNLKNIPLRVTIALLTVPGLIWTTQKGTILAWFLMLGFLVVNIRRPLNMLRIGLFTVVVLAIALPQIFEGYTMPQAEGVFSLSSFYLRIESMWPGAWIWIHAHEAFPFGVGLGGISGAQRLYAPINDMNATDNVFLLMYGYFGVMTFVYLAAMLMLAVKVKNDNAPDTVQAMATLVFLFGYGCVISLLEDQMATLFMGAALACLAAKVRDSSLHEKELDVYDNVLLEK